MNQDLIASEYATKGYVLVRSLIGADEVAALQAECQRVWEAADLSVQNLRTAPRVSRFRGRLLRQQSILMAALRRRMTP